MECSRDRKTGEPVGSILYEWPSQVPERHIINLLPLNILGVGGCIDAVAMVKNTVEKEKCGVREAAIKTVILLGVTDQGIIARIRNAPPPPNTARYPTQGAGRRPPTSSRSATSIPPCTTNPSSPALRSAVSTLATTVLHSTVKTKVPEVRGGFVPPHLRILQKKEEREKEMKEEEETGGAGKKDEKGREGKEREEEDYEKKVGGGYVPPHLRWARRMEERLREEAKAKTAKI
ncbi:hypothetical protein ABW20_dc0108562 [Dactylellina cionopaga]|nr:hypothetical protein ABW20_dc0108562 [Dactylellina cionopaga]